MGMAVRFSFMSWMSVLVGTVLFWMSMVMGVGAGYDHSIRFFIHNRGMRVTKGWDVNVQGGAASGTASFEQDIII